jgi:hypothetical protein
MAGEGENEAVHITPLHLTKMTLNGLIFERAGTFGFRPFAINKKPQSVFGCSFLFYAKI